MRLILTLMVFISTVQNGFSQCIITEIFATVDNCDDDDRFDVSLAFDYANTSDTFEVVGNGQNYGLFLYSELPITIADLNGDCNTNYEFIVRDHDNPGCSNFTGVGTVCCAVSCEITIFDFAHSTCQEGNTSTIAFSIEAATPNSNQFIVYGDDNYSMAFSYDQVPLSIENYPTGSGQLSNLIVCDDSPTGGCCDTLIFENPCTCSMTNTKSTIVDCDSEDSTYYVTIDFDHQMTSDSFALGENTVFFGYHAYADLPITVGPFEFNENSGLNFLIVDQLSTQCFNEVPVEVVDDCNFDCEISNVFAELYNCNDGMYSVDFEFDATDATNDDFYQIFINNELIDTITYGQVFYTFHNIELNCDEEFTISIVGPEGCQSSFTIEDVPCCPCPWRDFVASSFCDDGQTYVTFSYFQNVVFGTFFIDIGGEAFGPYDLSETDTIAVEGLAIGTYSIVMYDEVSGCETSTTFEVEECTPLECDIFDVVYEWYEECDGNLAKMDLQVEGENLADSFAISINGVMYGNYSYEPTFITIEGIELDCDETYELRIEDLGLSSCVEEIILEDLPCCEDSECDIRDLSITTECTTDSVYITLSFIYENVSDLFSLGVAGNNIGNFQYAELPIQFAVSAADYGEFRIADQGMENCVFEFNPPLECECDIFNLTLDYADCTDTSFAVVINFEFLGLNPTGSFIVRGNGVIYGEYDYEDLPIKIENLDPTTGIEYEFIVIATENDNCVEEYILGIADCYVNTTDINRIDWSVLVYNNTIKVIHNQEDVLINIYNISGQLTSNTASQIGSEIDISNIPKGIYIVNMVLKSGHSVSKKIIKL